jgi:16S rRNA (adenine1518-N6/adenine1519-N6)-dimethyltransferase
MGIYRPSELTCFLRELGISAKKNLSQNFLIDGNIISKIAASAQITPEDTVLEIGPGPGALTEALLKTGAKVIAIEKDPVLAQALARLQTSDNRLEIFEQDFLAFPLESVLKERLRKGQRAKVVANLPYHLTTPIIVNLVPLNALISSLTLMVQKEVADRFVAKKNCSDYSSFTVFLKYFTLAKYCFTIEPTCFHPKPKVRSAVVNFSLITPPQPVPIDFFRMTRTAFQKRRKMLRASLKELYGSENIENALRTIGLSHEARPQQLSLEEFIQMYHLVSERPS